MSGRGRHRFVDIAGVVRGSRALTDAEFLLGFMREAAVRCGATVVASAGKRLGQGDGTPDGVTCAVLLNESHVTAHTYAEDGAVAVDAFTCGEKANAEALVDLMLGVFPGGRVEQDRTFERFTTGVGPQETGRGAASAVDDDGGFAAGFCGGSLGVAASSGETVGDYLRSLVESLRGQAREEVEARRDAQWGPGGGNPRARVEEHLEWKAASAIEMLVALLDRRRTTSGEAKAESSRGLALRDGRRPSGGSPVDEKRGGAEASRPFNAEDPMFSPRSEVAPEIEDDEIED